MFTMVYPITEMPLLFVSRTCLIPFVSFTIVTSDMLEFSASTGSENLMDKISVFKSRVNDTIVGSLSSLLTKVLMKPGSVISSKLFPAKSNATLSWTIRYVLFSEVPNIPSALILSTSLVILIIIIDVFTELMSVDEDKLIDGSVKLSFGMMLRPATSKFSTLIVSENCKITMLLFKSNSNSISLGELESFTIFSAAIDIFNPSNIFESKSVTVPGSKKTKELLLLLPNVVFTSNASMSSGDNTMFTTGESTVDVLLLVNVMLLKVARLMLNDSAFTISENVNVIVD